uniref:Uncharacterized protein n=1 Tax=Rhizophora mucronata TaxID=61149 RepID=A0A2P2NKP3_RHIMU
MFSLTFCTALFHRIINPNIHSRTLHSLPTLGLTRPLLRLLCPLSSVIFTTIPPITHTIIKSLLAPLRGRIILCVFSISRAKRVLVVLGIQLPLLTTSRIFRNPACTLLILFPLAVIHSRVFLRIRIVPSISGTMLTGFVARRTPRHLQ